MCSPNIVRVFHWGPLVAIGIIKLISLTALSCILQWWPPLESLSGFVHALLFFFWDAVVLYNFFAAIIKGPGFVPLRYKSALPHESLAEHHQQQVPENSFDTFEELLQFCVSCQGYKAPRAHHCRKCNRCVLKMDHHCPWINHCVGHMNHLNFTLFLVLAICGCIHASVPLCVVLCRSLHASYYFYHLAPGERFITLSMYGFLAVLLAIGLAFGVIVSVGILAYQQIRGILRNRTGIEDWIEEKAVYWRDMVGSDPFVYPYDLGKWTNFKEFLSSSGNGLVWSVRDGCDQFTLTREQLRQKNLKRERAREYEIQRPYSGAWFPVSHGLLTFFSPPCTDDPRIPLLKGDYVTVTRWKRRWMYGEKRGRQGANRVRGWFPRRIAVEVEGFIDKKSQ